MTLRILKKSQNNFSKFSICVTVWRRNSTCCFLWKDFYYQLDTWNESKTWIERTKFWWSLGKYYKTNRRCRVGFQPFSFWKYRTKRKEEKQLAKEAKLRQKEIEAEEKEREKMAAEYEKEQKIPERSDDCRRLYRI